MQTQLRLGNDIVDCSLRGAKDKYQEQRFLQRVFTYSEQQAIQKSLNPNKLLWLLWAAKEAAYKACQKEQLNLVFSHRSFAVTAESVLKLQQAALVDEMGYGIIEAGSRLLEFQWQCLSPAALHVTAALSDQSIVWGDILMKTSYQLELNPDKYQQQSYQTRQLLYDLLSEHAAQGVYELCRPEIIKNGIKRKGPPVLFINNAAHPQIDVSLSHDGGWLSCVYYKNS